MKLDFDVDVTEFMAGMEKVEEVTRTRFGDYGTVGLVPYNPDDWNDVTWPPSPFPKVFPKEKSMEPIPDTPQKLQEVTFTLVDAFTGLPELDYGETKVVAILEPTVTGINFTYPPHWRYEFQPINQSHCVMLNASFGMVLFHPLGPPLVGDGSMSVVLEATGEGVLAAVLGR